jgi:SH3 domain protein
MKRIFKYVVIVILWGTVFSPAVSAQYIYVSGIKTITVRTGTSVTHKIVAMVKSGTRLEVIKHEPDWTFIKTPAGKEGWILTRFVTDRIPEILLVNELKKSNKELISNLVLLEEKNKELMSNLVLLEEKNKELTVKNTFLENIEEKYNQLKKEAADYLRLKVKYKEITKRFQEQASQMEDLKGSLDNEKKLWVLCGAGVFIVGLILGLSTRKKRRSSLL